MLASVLPILRFRGKLAKQMGISVEYLLWLLPVLIASSLVMAATRHEQVPLILKQAVNTGIWTLSFLLAIAAALWFAMFWIG